MNYNQFSKPRIFPRIPINNRAKLDTGTLCNYKCHFCYYLDKLDEVTSLETIKERIDVIYNSKITEIDLSGGESSLHKNWFEILSYCDDRFENISTLSNGYKFADWNFIKKSRDFGLKEIMFSLHGYDEKSHDLIVGKNNAFKHMLQAIRNAQKLDIKVRINCTVTSKNVYNLKTYVKLLTTIEPAQINFLPLNYWDTAKNVAPESYEILSGGIIEAIDILEKDLPDTQINVRYIPFCFMIGYEKYVVDTYQHIYDLDDWNIMMYDGEKLDFPTKADYFETAFKKRNYSYNKNKECFNCKYYLICDGLENNLENQKVYPVEGAYYSNVMEFRGDYERV